VTQRWSSGAALELCDEVAKAVQTALAGHDDWSLAQTQSHQWQYRSDLVADAAALDVLARHHVGVLSEESGLRHADRPLLVVVDPLDGSTNASRRVPWYATSICAVDDDGPLASVVVNLASGMRFDAVRGGGARCDGVAISPTSCATLSKAFVGLNGLPPKHFGWQQYRTFGAAALDLCAVACGVLDGYLDCAPDAHGVWDYLGGVLVCTEAGAVVADGLGRSLLVRDPALRRTPAAAATPSLLAELVAMRQTFV
jgi:myo-inositol-1(or 4)-monophosphatase